MIDAIHATDVALIRDASIAFSDGLTVITGESGSGKTALLSAVKLLVGERSSADMVREGSRGLVVEGRYFTGDDEDGRVVKRRVDGRGRSRVTIDGSLSSVKELAESLGSTVDLCGQHEHQRLLSAAHHAELLDAWVGAPMDSTKAAYREALASARDAARELERVVELGRTAAGRLDQARFELDRIDAVAPKERELDELAERLPRVENAEMLMRAADDAYRTVTADDGVADRLAAAVRGLRQASSADPELEGYAASLESALIEAEDVAASLRSYRDSQDLDPAELASMQSRQAELQGLMRTFGPTMEDVFARRAAAAEVVEAAEGTGEAEAAARAAADAAETVLAQKAREVDRLRREAAQGLADAVTAQMGRLMMGGASLEVAVTLLDRADWTAAGPSSVELMYRPGEGMAPRPLRKVASGGEVSRVTLACKVVLGDADEVETLVFDEVDAGVGGTTAVALAQVLSDLAESHQVICVTHLPQVAVAGDSHFVVRKVEGADGVPETRIEEVEGEERVAEIARMLAGDESEASLAHARELLSAN